jgi:peptidoglycan L-alanyl-D-glutamate endopeptidase CwlK
MASRELSDLVPPARERCLKWQDACKKRGVDVLVYCTFRSRTEQDEIYKVGRTVVGENPSTKKPMGNTVTNAQGGDSVHQWRCAWDAVPLVFGKPAWGRKDLYALMGTVAKDFGIEWAGNWKSFKEQAHFQYTGGLSLADLKQGKEVK